MSLKSSRQRWMAILARASVAEMTALLPHCPDLPEFTVLRGPQSGLVMLRGRAGGGGGQFNLAYVAGRDPAQAELAARLDAALQDPARHDAIESHVIARLELAQAARREADAERAAATRVQFFTMATMRS